VWAVVYPDLDRQQALHQVFDSLNYLERAVEDVFTRISARVGTERQKLQQIASRTATAQVCTNLCELVSEMLKTKPFLIELT
jgi:hypothetical protein